MQTFYEQLRLQPSATTAEIETALEEQYNQWRRLITHHDPNIVNQANQSLQTLEIIRSVLSDPTKRSVYDVGIGVSGPMSGLADPEALLRANASFTPPATGTSQPRVVPLTSSASADAWVCSKCQTINPLKTRFCVQCGLQLGRDCPSCGRLTKASAPFCAECGVNFEEFARHKKIEENKQRTLAQLRQSETDAARKWIDEIALTKNNYRYNPDCQTLVAEGSFNDVFEHCRLTIERFQYKSLGGLWALGAQLKEVDSSGGKIASVVGPRSNPLNLQIFVQKNLTQLRGVVLVSTMALHPLWTGRGYQADFNKQLITALSSIRAR